MALAALALAACGVGRPEGPSLSSPMATSPSPAGEGVALDDLGPFVAAHWETLPLPVQGPAPPAFQAIERSLDPTSCGACHPVQYAQWRESVHARAHSPGLAGQLIEGALSAPAEVRACQSCHDPLGEQQPWTREGAPESAFDPELRARGLVCAGCHVRAHRRFGPPRRPDLPPLPPVVPHGGFEARVEFQQSAFCAPCHQFFDDAGVNGKPVQNTWAEWRASPQAATGRSCQSCHMPDRAHTWKGIHDAETVRSAVDVALRDARQASGTVRGTLVVTNRDVGHAFPTYVTPRVQLAVWQSDAEGRELSGTRVEATIGREIDFAAWEERFDTRVPPGGSERLDYARPRHAGATALVARVTVDPDHHYRGVYRDLLESLEDAEARHLIALALRRAESSGYVLRELRQPLP